MKLEIQCKNYRMTDGLEAVIRKKANRLEKYFPDDDAVMKIVLSQQNKLCKMEVSVSVSGNRVRAEVDGQTMYYIIDEIMPKLERQILKYKDKLYSKRKGGAPAYDNDFLFVAGIVEPQKEDYEIAKVKRFPIEECDVKEAIENLELVGHDFYLFVNSATKQVEAVYRRNDGRIGLLQPYFQK